MPLLTDKATMISKITRVLTLLCSLALTAVNAENVQFYQPTTGLGIALLTSIRENGTQLLMQISVPTIYTWAAFGSNSKMADSIMFVIYPSADGKTVTLSPRTTWEHVPPLALPKGVLDVYLSSSEITDNHMIANIIWNDRGQKMGLAALPDRREVDVNSDKQPFIWAVGPLKSASTPINVNDNDASPPLTKHSEHGAIIVDMASSQNRDSETVAPTVTGTSSTSNVRFQPKYYHALVHVHLILLCTAVVGLFPLGVIGLRLDIKYKGTMVHWVIQCVAATLVLVGFAIALTFSVVGMQYSAFCTPHQITAIAVCALVPFQVLLGRFGALRLQSQRKRSVFSYVHFVTGRLVIYGGAIASILGFMLNKNMSGTIITIVCSVVLIAPMEFLAIRAWRKARKGKAPARMVGGYDFEARRLGGRYHKLKEVSIIENEVETLEPYDHYSGSKNIPIMESEVEEYKPGDRYDKSIPVMDSQAQEEVIVKEPSGPTTGILKVTKISEA